MNFEIKQRDVAYRGRAFDVQRLTVRLPDESVRVFDLVEHNPSITVVPVTDDGRILFVRQYRMGAEEDLLELPAGVLETDEDPAVGARREPRKLANRRKGRDRWKTSSPPASLSVPALDGDQCDFGLGHQS